MGIREWLRKHRFGNSNACRIPPSPVKFSDQIATSSKGVSRPIQSFSSLIDARVGALLIIALISIANIPAFSSGGPLSSEITELEEVNQNRFITASTEEIDGKNEIVLANSTPFIGEPEWRPSVFPNSQWYTVTSRGVLSSFTDTTSGVTFSRTECISVSDYDEVELAVGVEVLSGDVNITLNYDFWKWRYRDIAEKKKTWCLGAGDSEVLTLDAPMALLRTVSPNILIYTYVRIRIESTHQSSVLLANASITATSAGPLSMVSVDFLSTLNESLYANEMFSEISQPPVVFITDLGTTYNGTLISQNANQTIYMSPGEYSFACGWSNRWAYYDDFPILYPLSINVSIQQHERVVLQPRIRALKLHFAGFQGIIFEHGYIQTGEYTNLYSIWSETRVLPSFVYIPYDTSYLAISLYTQSRMFDIFLQGRGYFQIADYAVGDGTHNYMFSVTLPTISIAGFGYGIGEAIASFFTLALFGSVLKRIREYRKKESLVRVIHSEHFLPAILVGISIFIPWHNYTNPVGLAYIEHYAVFPPLSIFIQHTDSSFFMIASIPPWYLWVFLTLVLFWYPLYLIFLSFTNPNVLNTSKSFAKMLLRPIILNSLFLIPVIIGSAAISFGSILIFASLPVYAIQLSRSGKLPFGREGGES